MDRIHLTEVAPRDGLQNQPVPLETADKLVFIGLLAQAGVSSLEATSFVSKKAVPQLADADALLPQVHAAYPGLRVSALVPNRKGLARAQAAGAREIAVVLAATDTMNRRNIGMSLLEATQESAATIAAARGAGLRTRAYLAVAFACPFEGETPMDAFLTLASTLHRAGADEVVIADTIGAASPAQVRDRLRAVRDVLPLERTGVHFHDTRGMGLANAWAALEAGVRRIDASAGGLGGCPFAPGAAGNLATEDLVLMASQSGLATGVDLDGLMEAIAYAEQLLRRPLGGRSSAWLRRHTRTTD